MEKTDEMDFKEMKYGLIAVDNRTIKEDGNATILHFCGFWRPPTTTDVELMMNDLAETPELGVMDIIEHVGIYEAPEELVKEYRDEILEGSIEQFDTKQENAIL